MSNEQIEQNAEECASKIYGYPYVEDVSCRQHYIDGYIAGAHSRDEEIKELQKDVHDFEQALACAEDVVDIQRKELKQLRNPWISVEERLPQESKKYKGWLSDTVFVITNKNDGTSARYDHATKTWCPAKILQGSITHWMPIPELKKGE